MELMQASLPPKLARLSWAQCLDEMDKLGQSEVFLGSVLQLIAKAARLEAIILENGERAFPIYTLRDQTSGMLSAIYIKFPDSPVVINVRQMDEIRQILAAQNDYQIPDENWNPDLVSAQQYLADANEGRLKMEIDAWVYSVAVNSRTDVEDIWEWPIRKFKGYDKAIDRSLGYQIYTLAQAAGFSKFENGAPFPTWRFDKNSDLPFGFKELGQLEAKAKGQLPEPTKI